MQIHIVGMDGDQGGETAVSGTIHPEPYNPLENAPNGTIIAIEGLVLAAVFAYSAARNTRRNKL